MRNGKLMISVILPVKDGDPKYLKRAINSVLEQSCSNSEILLVDDGSASSFAEELDRIASDTSAIRLFHIASSGVSFARNYAVQKAEGDIITFLDSDDVLPPGCFEEAVCLLKETDADALFGGTCYLSPEEMKARLDRQPSAQPSSPEDLLESCIVLDKSRLHQTRAECIGEPYRFGDGGYINRGIAARFIRREVFRNKSHLFPPGIIMYEDTLWNLEMMNDLRILYVPRIWYYYLNNDASVSNRFHADFAEELSIPIQKIRSMLDLENTVEYRAYTRFLLDSLRYVFKCSYSRLDPVSNREKKRNIKKDIYHRDPWKEIGTSQFRKSAGPRDQLKSWLFKLHLLFPYWTLS